MPNSTTMAEVQRINVLADQAEQQGKADLAAYYRTVASRVFWSYYTSK